MSCLESLRGVLPTSMLDWPGKICTVLFMAGCNYRCPYCHNPELVEAGKPDDVVLWEEVALFLEEREGWIDGVSVTGGEPTLHADLPDLCRSIRDMGMLVKVDTNGSRPEILKRILAEGLLDFVAMDLKASLPNYSRAAGRQVGTAGIEDSVAAILKGGVDHEFRCTVVPGLVDLPDLESIAAMITGARGLVLQQFRPDKTLDPSYTGRSPYAEELLVEWADALSRFVPTKVRGLLGVTQG